MDSTSKLLILILTLTLKTFDPTRLVIAANVPCAARQGDDGQGQICVCNSTYCDTIERPIVLPRGQYYWYSTSNSTPGFSMTTGNFMSEPPLESNTDFVFTINSSVIFQEILGFGGSFTDSVGIVFNSLPEDAQDKFIQSYFGPQSIEYSLGRVPIAASDFSTRYYTYDEVPFDVNLDNFSLADEDYNYKIPVIKRAMSASTRGLSLYGSAWFVPSWLKTNVSGYFKNEYLHTWAKYHVKFVQAYKESGVDIWGLSAGNELMLGYEMSFFNTLMLAPTQRLYLKSHLIPQLKAANLSHVKFLALDDVRIFAAYYMNRFSEDPEAFQLLEGVALHWYFDHVTSTSILDCIHNKFPDKLIMYTESSIWNGIFGGKSVELGSWYRASAYIYDIIKNFNHWTNGYIDWNLALNTTGGPNSLMNLDSAIIVNKTSEEFYKQPLFYGIGHFSKFIPPGSRRMEVKSNQNNSVADTSDRSFMKIAPHLKRRLNTNHPKTESLKYLPPRFNVPSVVLSLATANSDGSFTVIIFNSKNETVNVRIEDPKVGSIFLKIQEHSINSFIFWY